MLFWLKKTLTLPFLPLHFAMLAGLVGLLLLFLTKRQKLARILLALALTVLAVFSNRGVARLLIAPLESQHPALPQADLPTYARDCRYIVVLGGGHGDSPALPPTSQLSTSALGRLVEGVRLARLLPDTKLIVSGYDGPRKISHAQVLSGAAQSLGLSADRIIRFDHTRDTDDEARAIHSEIGPAPFLLVTSAWHMPRAIALCRKADLNPVAAPADFMQKSAAPTAADWFGWDLGALERSTKSIHEYLGLCWSKLRGQA